jgi:hypothetical protein
LPRAVVRLAQHGLGLVEAPEVAEVVAPADLELCGERGPAERFDVGRERFDLGQRFFESTRAVENARAAESTADLGDGLELIRIRPHHPPEAQLVRAIGRRLHHGDGGHRVAGELRGRLLERFDDGFGLATLHVEARLDPRASDRRHAVRIGGARLGPGGAPGLGPPVEPRLDALHRGLDIGDAARRETGTHRVDAFWPQLRDLLAEAFALRRRETFVPRVPAPCRTADRRHRNHSEDASLHADARLAALDLGEQRVHARPASIRIDSETATH